MNDDSSARTNPPRNLMLLVNTPLLDFRSISLASQFARVERGEIEMSLQSGEIEAIPPEFQELRIGEVEPSFFPR